MSLGTMDIFKTLPAAKKTADANCKKCGCASCMMFAVKLSKGEIDCALCPNLPDELLLSLSHSKKIQQQTVEIKGTKKTLTVGGEKTMFRHQKGFINPPPFLVALDFRDKNFNDTIKRISEFKFEYVGEEFTVDGVTFSPGVENPPDEVIKTLDKLNLNYVPYSEISKLTEVLDVSFPKTLDTLINIRTKAVIDRDENYSTPPFVHLKGADIENLCAKASAYVSKYASMLLFDTFDEALFSTLYILRQNIFIDPEMPLQVESKVYEFNNPDENADVFLTTNFALSYFAVANEISNLENGAYLVITPSDGMSVLTAWSAQKITAEIASKVVSANDTLGKVKNKRIIIPGLLYDLKEDLEKALPDWKIVVGTIEAYKIPEFVKKLKLSGE